MSKKPLFKENKRIMKCFLKIPRVHINHKEMRDMKDAYTKTPEQVLSELHSDGSSGLTKEQAEQSRKKYGPIPLSGKAMNLC